MSHDPHHAWNDIETLLHGMVAHQEGKVLGLARRLHPGVTAEDIRNPHDFPDLDDADFNYEDGLLAGLQAALTAVRARQQDLEHHPARTPGTDRD